MPYFIFILCVIGWAGWFWGFYVALTMFQPYRDLKAGDIPNLWNRSGESRVRTPDPLLRNPIYAPSPPLQIIVNTPTLKNNVHLYSWLCKHKTRWMACLVSRIIGLKPKGQQVFTLPLQKYSQTELSTQHGIKTYSSVCQSICMSVNHIKDLY